MKYVLTSLIFLSSAFYLLASPPTSQPTPPSTTAPSPNQSLPVVILAPATTGFFRNERNALRSLHQITKHPEERAILAGMHWLASYLEKEDRFLEGFADFIWIMNELTHSPHRPKRTRLAKQLILHSFQRAFPKLHSIYSPDLSDKWGYISLLPLLYKYKQDIRPYLLFHKKYFPKDLHTTQTISYEEAVQKKDYDTLGDYLIEESFLDLLMKRYPHNPFFLPVNEFPEHIRQLDNVPFLYTFDKNEDGYHKQNYFITHIIMAMNHYGESALPQTPLLRRVGDYLERELPTVRHKVDDIDLLAEFLYCLKALQRPQTPTYREGIQYLLRSQHKDGSWGTQEELQGETYDAMHPTWTVITALGYHIHRLPHPTKRIRHTTVKP